MGDCYNYSTKQRVFLVSEYHKLKGDYCKIFAKFSELYPDVPVPTRQVVLDLDSKFQLTGSVADLPERSTTKNSAN